MLHCSATVHPLPEMNPLAPPLSPNFLLIWCHLQTGGSYWGWVGLLCIMWPCKGYPLPLTIYYVWVADFFVSLCMKTHWNAPTRFTISHLLNLRDLLVCSILFLIQCPQSVFEFPAASVQPRSDSENNKQISDSGSEAVFQTMNHICDRWTMAAVRCTWTSLWWVVWTLTFVETPLCHGPGIPVRDHRLIALIICLCLLAELV